MVVTITASTFTGLVDDTDITTTVAETLIDQAIDCLNLYLKDDSLPNMTGTAGSKTVSVESYERGAIINVTRLIYRSFYKKEKTGSVQLGPYGTTNSDLLSNPSVLSYVEKQSRQIWRMRNPMEVSSG